MKKVLLISSSLLLLATACVKNKGEVSYTYNKAIAQYDDIDAIRSQDLVQAPKQVQNMSKVFYGENVVLIGERNEGIHIINNTNRSIPVKSSFLNLPYCNEFYVDGQFLYAETHYDLVKIDLSNLSAPTLVHRAENAISTPIRGENGKVLVGFKYKVVNESFKLNSPEEVSLRQNNTLYFDYNNQMIPAGDVPPSFASTSGKNKGTMNKMEITDDHLYLITRDKVKTYSLAGNNISKTDEKVVGFDLETIYHENGKLFIGTKSSMIIMNNDNPSAPYVQSTYAHEVSCDPVLPNGDVTYLTLRSVQDEGCSGTVNLLKVVDVSNINNPTNIKDVQMRSPYGMTISNDHLFVGEGINGLSVLDITDPRNPVEVSHNNNFQTFDVIKHPVDQDIILVITSNDVKQLQFNESSNSIQELSSLLN